MIFHLNVYPVLILSLKVKNCFNSRVSEAVFSGVVKMSMLAEKPLKIGKNIKFG